MDQLTSQMKDRMFAINLVQQLVVPTFVIDQGGKVLIWNGACERLTGVLADEVVGTSAHWMGFYPMPRMCLADVVVQGREADLPKLYEHYSAASEIKFGIKAENWCIMPRKDARLYLAIDAAPIYDEEGQLIAVVETLRDLTVRKLAEEELEQTKNSLVYAQKLARIGSWEWDVRGNTAIWSEVTHQVFGVDHIHPGEHIASFLDIVDANDRARVEQALNDALRGLKKYDIEYRIWLADGTYKILHALAEVIRDEVGQPLKMLGTVQDVTERKNLEEALKESDEKLRGLFELSSLGIALTDMDGRYIEFNESFRRICGYPEDELKSLDYWTLTPKKYEADEARQLAQLTSTGHYGPYEKEYVRKDGTLVPICLNGLIVMGRDGQKHIWSIVEEISERKLLENKIRNMAFYDALTHLPNRRLLNDRLDQTLLTAKRSEHYGALIFLDLDNFKPLNDQFGHAVGDLLLIEVARRISACVRKTDTAARFGGDEFVVLLGELHQDLAESTRQANAIAQKILNTLSAPYLLTISDEGNGDREVEHHCSASVGVAIFDQHAACADVFKWADTAMYAAKNSGRNRVVINQQGSDFLS
jgi:diguanylate cyclase (GGDEF)-like protein/PAS domain S-box-containing protein